MFVFLLHVRLEPFSRHWMLRVSKKCVNNNVKRDCVLLIQTYFRIFVNQQFAMHHKDFGKGLLENLE